MCTECYKKKQHNLTATIQGTGLEWLSNLQRIYYANKTANNPTEQQEIIAIKRLNICEGCEHLKQSDLINIANDLLTSDETSEKLEPHIKKQCGLCGCSCVLLAYDQLPNSKPCKIDKF